MDHVPDGQLGNLSADGSGDIGDLYDLPGDMVGTGILPDPPLDPGYKVLG